MTVLREVGKNSMSNVVEIYLPLSRGDRFNGAFEIYYDDVQYNTRKKYPFAVAVFDDSGEEHSYNSEPLKLQFK